MHQSLELSVWLGVAGLAFTSAQILLWRTRRLLSQARQAALVQEISLVPSVALTPSVITQSAESVIAS